MQCLSDNLNQLAAEQRNFQVSSRSCCSSTVIVPANALLLPLLLLLITSTDTSLAELNGSLLREEEGLVAGRGLVTGYTGDAPTPLQQQQLLMHPFQVHCLGVAQQWLASLRCKCEARLNNMLGYCLCLLDANVLHCTCPSTFAW